MASSKVLGPALVFAELHRAAQAACGARLFTVTVLDREARLARRAYSSHPSEYPVAGAKPMRSDAWTQQVIVEGRSFIANTTEGFMPYLADHALINALGCEAVMNIPVSDGACVVGAVNILDAKGHFTPERIAALEGIVEECRPRILEAMAATAS